MYWSVFFLLQERRRGERRRGGGKEGGVEEEEVGSSRLLVRWSSNFSVCKIHLQWNYWFLAPVPETDVIVLDGVKNLIFVFKQIRGCFCHERFVARDLGKMDIVLQVLLCYWFLAVRASSKWNRSRIGNGCSVRNSSCFCFSLRCHPL